MQALRTRGIDDTKYIRLAYDLLTTDSVGAGKWWADTIRNRLRLERIKKMADSEFGPCAAWIETMEHD